MQNVAKKRLRKCRSKTLASSSTAALYFYFFLRKQHVDDWRKDQVYVSRISSCSQIYFLKLFSYADKYVLGQHWTLNFFSTCHNLRARRQKVLVQSILAWAVGWKSMAACSEIMQCRKKLKSLKCAKCISASENNFKKKF